MHNEHEGERAEGERLTRTFFTCPYCWQQISMLLEVGFQSQSYIEDCEVCCQPIQIRYTTFEEGDKAD